MADTQNPTVLLVEDDETLARLYMRQFEMDNISCTHAADGKSALDLLKIVRPSVILLDISLPDTDGFEILKVIKADPNVAQIPVIIMSNFSRPEDIEWGKKLGAKKFVEKVSLVPADVVDLVREEAKQ
ncbi:MAG: response regulator [Patescibacteria group bacterium]